MLVQTWVAFLWPFTAPKCSWQRKVPRMGHPVRARYHPFYVQCEQEEYDRITHQKYHYNSCVKIFVQTGFPQVGPIQSIAETFESRNLLQGIHHGHIRWQTHDTLFRECKVLVCKNEIWNDAHDPYNYCCDGSISCPREKCTDKEAEGGHRHSIDEKENPQKKSIWQRQNANLLKSEFSRESIPRCIFTNPVTLTDSRMTINVMEIVIPTIVVMNHDTHCNALDNPITFIKSDNCLSFSVTIARTVFT